MATITPTFEKIGSPDGGGISGYVVTWADMANGDVGALPMNDNGDARELLGASDRSAQLFGALGSGGTATIQGTNESAPAHWATLNDPQGNALTMQSAKIEQILENTLFVRPSITAGDGTTLLTVVLSMRRKG